MAAATPTAPALAAPTTYFSSDRAAKYGWGLVRLALLTLAAFQLAPRFSSAVAAPQAFALSLVPYLASYRWVTHVYIGIIGAAVNVRLTNFATSIALLLIAGVLCAWDARLDYAILVYLVKTGAGDTLAGKLDTTEWGLALFFVFALFAPALWLLDGDAPAACTPYARIAPLLFVVQTVCEFGDNYWERYVFFRHRYSFEILTAVLLFALAPTAAELVVIQHDLVVCLLYRVSNFAIIAHKNGLLRDALAASSDVDYLHAEEKQSRSVAR